jgi:hypothetical protein
LTYNLIAIFLAIAILRLLPFNFYLSILVGHDVVIDNKEGNAINFLNYIATILLAILILVKVPKMKTYWKESWPYVMLSAIYLINSAFAPMSNHLWLIYQLTFIAIAWFLHLITVRSDKWEYRFIAQGGFGIFTILILLFFVFTGIQLYSTFSVDYIFEEYNDSFVNSLNVFGVMKQYFGYTAGFLILYAIFILKSRPAKWAVVLLVLLTAFGIRSFAIGLVGCLLLFASRRVWSFLLILTLLVGWAYVMWQDLVIQLVFDTRFYAFMNAYDIIQNFPFGVGLGGYPEYTEINNRDLFASFYNVNAALDYVPNSPESDFVHLFGSLGLGLGVLHLLIQLRMIFLGSIVQRRMLSFEKLMLYYFVFMTFFGISEDTMFTISYWIFFGITSGIIANVRSRK